VCGGKTRVFFLELRLTRWDKPLRQPACGQRLVKAACILFPDG
jgi:hypothetical protein